MFYSHTFLARKGPLGTVWCAAHLQHKLKKSHYTSTNVFSTAERIMNPEAPIALRMSGHLLLGIVRIYSKQVDYLHQDCKGALILLTRACLSLKLNELDPASPDPSSVPLPKIFKLDEVMVDENSVRPDDHHVKSTEDITLPDHPSVIVVQNVVTNAAEAFIIDTSVPQDGSEPVPMDQDPAPSVPEENTENRGDPSAIDLFEIERMRDRDNDTVVVPNPVLGVLMDDRIEPDRRIEERFKKDASRSPPNIPHEVLEDDHHFKSTEDDTHVTDAVITDTSVPEDASGQPMPMDQDSPAPFVVPEIEIMRDQDHDTVTGSGASIIGDLMGVRIEPDGQLEEQYKRDASKSPSNNIPPQDHLEMPSAGFEDRVVRLSRGRGTPDSASRTTYPVRESPEMVLRDSPTGPGSVAVELPPTPQVVQQRVRQRKRKVQLYDEATVFTNEEMKKFLGDTSNLLRKKRLRRIDNLGVWKQQIRLKKDVVVFEPVITGISTELDAVCDPTQIHSKPRLIPSSEEPEAVPESPVRVVNDDMEIEHPRNFEDSNNVNNPMSELLMPSPQLNKCNSGMTMPSSSRGDIYTPTTIDTLYSDPFGTTNTTEVDTTPELTGSTADPETSTCLREGRFGQYSPLSDIPESAESPRHLDFLEKDDNSPAGTPASVRVGEKEVPQFDTLPATTRTVGQYIKRQSTGTPSSDNSNQSLKLDSILENKTKKICARMFFETLVLKSYGFVDVQEEEPFSEIKLKVTSKLKEQCSA